MKVYDIGILCKRNHKIRDRRADITDHNAADDQHRHIPDLSGDQKHKSHGNQRTHESRHNHHRRTRGQAFSQKKDHRQGDRQLGSRRDSQDKRPRNRVVEESLEQET